MTKTTKIMLPLTILVLVLYGFHRSRVNQLAESISSIEDISRVHLLEEKELRVEEIKLKDTLLARYFLEKFNPENGFVLTDTTSVLFPFFSSFSYKKYSLDYLNCLEKASMQGLENDSVLESLEEQIILRIGLFGSHARAWFEHIGKDKFLTNTYPEDGCNIWKLENGKIGIDPDVLGEFDEFLEQWAVHNKAAEGFTQESNAEYEAFLSRSKRALNNTGSNHLSELLSNSPALTETKDTFYFQRPKIGRIDYAVASKSFNADVFNSALTKATFEQYKNNSLYTGATPYRYCFGGNGGCNDWGCSTIKVKASNNSDVLVIIKRDGEVFRHAYIQAGDRYQIELPNGYYQPFFYYGTGWNPEKYMKQAACGDLKGGFVRGEHVGKDSPQFLSNQVLSYELVLQQNGNFSTKPSNTQEAL